MYNYRHFRAAELAAVDSDGPPPGCPLPGLTVANLAGAPVSLADFRGRPLLLEAGSLSCPMFWRHGAAMNALAREFPAVHCAILYTREAHPGRRLPPHARWADKLARARELAARGGAARPVLVDDLPGTAHRALGPLPNWLYLADQHGVVVYRAKWASPAAARAAIQGLARHDLLDGIRSEFRLGAPWRVAWELRRAGADAIVDFARAYPALLRRQWASRRPRHRHR